MMPKGLKRGQAVAEKSDAPDVPQRPIKRMKTASEVSKDPEYPEALDLSEVKILDPNGDVILVLENSDSRLCEKYLVQSKILGLVSPVFNRMFSPNFSEGIRVRNGETPCINLEEDDATAMGIILRIIHHQSDEVPSAMCPEDLADLALLCDKYDCHKPLTTWIATWCNSTVFTNFASMTPASIRHALLAAHMFKLGRGYLSKLIIKASKFLGRCFDFDWAAHDLLSLLPEALTPTLIECISCTVEDLWANLDAVEKSLQQRGKGFQLFNERICMKCDIIFTKQEKKCKCGDYTSVRYCTPEFRVAAWCALLRGSGLHHPYKDLSVHKFCLYVNNMAKEHGHRCGGGRECPMRVALDKLAVDSLGIRVSRDIDWTWNTVA